MANGIYTKDFASVFSKLLEKNSISCYQISKYTSLDEAYLSCLRNGKKNNPSLPVIIKISLALTHFGKNIAVHDIEDLYASVGRSIGIR